MKLIWICNNCFISLRFNHFRSLGSMNGSNVDTVVEWELPGTRFRSPVSVSPGSCGHGQHRRACVDSSGALTLSYVHPEDRGHYTCRAGNELGNFSRSVQLEVKVSCDNNDSPRIRSQVWLLQVLNIILFPVSVAASFVTLSWNTSQSLARDYILQVALF